MSTASPNARSRSPLWVQWRQVRAVGTVQLAEPYTPASSTARNLETRTSSGSQRRVEARVQDEIPQEPSCFVRTALRVSKETFGQRRELAGVAPRGCRLRENAEREQADLVASVVVELERLIDQRSWHWFGDRGRSTGIRRHVVYVPNNERARAVALRWPKAGVGRRTESFSAPE